MKEVSSHKGPIFVVGAARSGTTWVQCLIGAMEGFYSCPETHFFDELLSRKVIRSGYQLHRPRYHYGSNLIDTVHLRDIFEKCDAGFLRISNATRQELLNEAANGGLEVKKLFERLVVETSPPGRKGMRWVEKTPSHASYLTEIFHFFPEARVVCVLRAPESVLESAARVFGVPVSIAAIDYWRSYRAVRRFLVRSPLRRSDVLILNYERLLEDDEELRALCAFVGVESPDGRDLRKQAANIFADLYGDTFVYHTQAGMSKSSGRPGSQRRLRNLTKAAVFVVGRMLRSLMHLQGAPAASAQQTSWVCGVIATIADVIIGLWYVARWRAADLVHDVARYVRHLGMPSVR